MFHFLMYMIRTLIVEEPRFMAFFSKVTKCLNNGSRNAAVFCLIKSRRCLLT